MTSSDALFDKIEAIAAVSGKKDKAAITATLTPGDLEIVRWALDPTVTFYIAKLDAPEAIGSDEWKEDEICLLQDLSSRNITGDAALRKVGFSLWELSHKSGELLRRVILKDLRAGFGASSVNKVFFGAIPEFAYMRCSLPKASNIKKWDWARGVLSQLKANGMFSRVAVDSGRALITTRQGNTFPAGALANIEADATWTFPDNTETHGELTVWFKGVLLPRSEGNGILNSVMQGEPLPDWHEVRFDAWDQIPLDRATPGGSYPDPYENRLARLTTQIAAGGKSSIMLIESRLVYSMEEAMEHYKGILAQKLEGTVLKHPDAVWRDGDSKDQVKFKLEVDVDLKIVGFNPGTPGKRTADTFGSVRCQTIDGLLEVSVSGFKRDMELYLHENRDSVLNTIMCVRANEVSPPCETNTLHSLYHPRVVELRKDKTEADSLQQVLDQFEAAVAA